jgi:hypothetical protein
VRGSSFAGISEASQWNDVQAIQEMVG